MPLEPGEVPRHISFSQRTSFSRCPEAFRLQRVWHVPETPSWWLAGGKAVHEVTELEDRLSLGQDVTVPTFAEVFQREVDEMVEKSGIPESEFRASGRASNAWPGKENKDWWLHHGPAMVVKWREFRRNAPVDIHEVPAPLFGDQNRTVPAIELEINLKVAGTTIKLFIDRVMRRRSDGALGVIDLKTGANEPASPDQLGLYKLAMEEEFGEQVTWGAFWDARKGSTGQTYDLGDFTHERIEWEYETFRFARDHGLFLANPGPMCNSCSVKDYCYIQRGPKADEVPRPWEQFVEGEEVLSS
jgi:putative RecB family exonuclease